MLEFEEFIEKAQPLEFDSSITIDEIIERGTGIVVDSCYLDKVLKERPDVSGLYIYTLLDDDTIVPGFAFINRQGYIFTKHPINEEVSYR